MRTSPWLFGVVWLSPLMACQSGEDGPPPASGGTSTGMTGGDTTGGSALGGDGPTGGDWTGGAGPNAGGTSPGGMTGGVTGGQPSGGQDSVGGASGGDAGGGMSELFQVEVHLASEDDSRAPTTVGVVSWSTSVGTPTAATIEFGLTTDYGMTVAVDVTAADLRTLLLGMKPEQIYHFRIVAEVGDEELVSEDFTVTTGRAPDALQDSIHYDMLSGDEREPGFVLTSYWNGSGMVFVLDQDGDVVWWYDSGLASGIGKAAISEDGRDMWMVTAAAAQNEPLVRVGMDGLGFQTYQNVSGSHDIIPVEGDVMAFPMLFSAAEVNRAGETRAIMPPLDTTTFPLPHCNAIAYHKASGTYLVSDLTEDVYLFPRAGGTPDNMTYLTTILGPNSGWGGYQHGLQLLSNNHLLMFANRTGTEPRTSSVIEYNLETGEEVWRYEGEQYSENFGGVQRLPGGNTLVTYSNAGIIHETTADKKKVLEITTNKYLGYSTWLPSLYNSSWDAEE